MTYFHEHKRPEGAEITVEYDYKEGSGDYFAGGCWMPGDDAEVEIIAAFGNDGGVTLTTAECEAIEAAIYADPPNVDPYDDWIDYD
ncbi:hypothetical protein SAMN04515647_4407 [Cohaesibacter sp. ES.047]|uniref:hypothetical protein n=1 Tax=Cohaesibacter sp. ES.047 TaxID=1798205 RepID=UPI000BB89F71|nr:hypothetical protein [Cohaesibacter sp. ES.047]SNY94084.1 hypothetical protein SAMN04515647_4407 [Cohaesibacter sp. ES.047]